MGGGGVGVHFTFDWQYWHGLWWYWRCLQHTYFWEGKHMEQKGLWGASGTSCTSNIAEETYDKSFTTDAFTTKTGHVTSSLIICLFVSSVVFALALVIVFNCRGDQKKPTSQKVRFYKSELKMMREFVTLASTLFMSLLSQVHWSQLCPGSYQN